VKEDGTLVIAPNKRSAGYGHIDLANKGRVLAAGEGKVLNGVVKHLDNGSGHYKPRGASAKSAAVNAFKDAGFKVPASAYKEILIK